MARDVRVYQKRRWYILTVISLINFSNNMAWITFAPISSYTADYYGWETAPTLLNVIFMICAPIGIVSMWANAKYGLRLGCLLGAWLNLTGALLRLYASSDSFFFGDVSTFWRFRVTFVGQTMAACAQPFVMYLPAKLSAAWFPDSERVIANTLASLSNPLGAAAMFALAPHIVNATRPRAFFHLNGIVASAAMICAILSLGITASYPAKKTEIKGDVDKPCLGSDEKNSENINEIMTIGKFWKGIQTALSSRSFIVLLIGLGSGFGLFNALCNCLQPVLCAKGYSNSFSGGVGGGMIVAGLLTSALIGVFVGKTRLFEETMKACMCGTALAACALTVLSRFPNMEIWIACAVTAFGAFGLTTYPLGLELGVETTFPVPESTSTGLLSLTGQTFGVIYIFITAYLKRPASAQELIIQTCSDNTTPIGVYDWKYSFMTWNACLVATCIFFTFSFWPKYRRMEYEMGQQQTELPPSDLQEIRETIP